MHTDSQANPLLKFLVFILLWSAMIISVPLMFYISQPNELSSYIVTFIFVGILLVPYGLYFFINKYMNYYRKQSLIIFASCMIAILFAITMFYFGFFFDVDSQHGMYLLYVPLIQTGFCILTIIIVYLTRIKN